MSDDIITVEPSAEDMVPFDEAYLKELEADAKDRYSPEDSDYMQMKNQELPNPPIILDERPARGGRGGYQRHREWRGHHGQNNRNNHYNDRRDDRRYGYHRDRSNDSSYGHHHRNYDHRDNRSYYNSE